MIRPRVFFNIAFFILMYGLTGAGKVYGYGDYLQNKISLLVIDSDSYVISEAVKELNKNSLFRVRFFTVSELSSDDSLDWILSSRAIIVDVMDDRLADFIIKKIIPALKDKPLKIYAVRSSRRDKELKEKGFLFDDMVQQYYSNLSVRNAINMVLFVVNRLINSSIKYDDPAKNPELGIYHPDSDQIFSNLEDYLSWYKMRSDYSEKNYRIGIMFFSSFLNRGQVRVIDYIIRKLERNNFFVIPAFGPDGQVLTSFFISSGKPTVDLILSFSLKFSSSLKPEIQRAISKVDVPIINLINLYMTTIDEWYRSRQGIHLREVAWTLTNPEISGLIEPSVVSGKIRQRDSKTGAVIYYHRAIKENIDFLIPRLSKWIQLRQLPNRRKRIAILYYNHNQGKQNIGASYLNVFKSISQILRRLDAEGYQVDKSVKFTEDTIKDFILKYGRNVGSWAPGELEELLKSGNVVQVPISDYLKWYSRLPVKFREEVEKQWGKPEESKIMVKGGRFVIPAIFVGNVVLMPEPARGWGDDPMKLYHSPTLYPHHQYIAAYLWLKYGFKANAMIHLGTHATHEWLPGKQAGLSVNCPPEVLITDIPNIYPYIVDDVGEALQAKRRGRGVIIDHLIPVIKKSGLYKEYADLYEKIQRYNRSKAGGSVTAHAEFEGILSGVKKLGIDQDLGIEQLDEDTIEEVEHYLLELKQSFMPYGLHTFGVSPSGEALQEMAASIMDFNPKAGKQDILTKLRISGKNEMDSLVLALSGHYVMPGEGNDPLRNVNALPTGRNLYGLSPEKIPTREAFQIGHKIADGIIQKSLKEKGTYPRKVAVVLWAVETIRNGGVNESVILNLIGIKPLWDASGRVVGLKPVSGKELGRPRIDVFINPSGLYRDLFPEKLKFLNKAVKAALVQKDVENFLKDHAEIIERALIQKGYSENEARELSKVRIFSEKPGSYGTGVSEMTGLSGVWEKDDEIAKVYSNRVGYAFGAGFWGKKADELLKANLASVDTVMHSFSSNLYGAMDNDDVFQYLGGLALAVRKVRGSAPEAVVAMQRQPGEARVENLSRVLGKELRSRYLNPKWIEGMKREKYGGAREMAKFVENFWGFQVTTPESVSNSQWQQIYEVYVKDKYRLGIKKFFKQYNPWAYQSITARMLEAIRKGYWNADSGVKRTLALEYASSVVEKGVACCDHTCNNPFLNQMVVSLLSIPGFVNPELVQNFKATMEKAVGKTLSYQAQERKALQKELHRTAPGKSLKSTSNQNHYNQLKEVEGYRAEDINKQENKESKQETFSSSGLQWILMAFVLGFMLVFAIGYWNTKKNQLG